LQTVLVDDIMTEWAKRGGKNWGLEVAKGVLFKKKPKGIQTKKIGIHVYLRELHFTSSSPWSRDILATVLRGEKGGG